MSESRKGDERIVVSMKERKRMSEKERDESSQT